MEGILAQTFRCPVHLYTGQEAVATGVCKALTPRDYVFGTHRSHGHFLAKGGSLNELVAEVYCREVGCSRGRGGSMHLIDPETGMMGSAPIVAGTVSLALGAAMAIQARGEDRVSVSFFGDGATGEGVLYESINYAALRKLPVIFVCENNLYSTHMPIREIRVDRPIVDLAAPFGIRAARLDGNDVLAVHAEAVQASSACRAGMGPVFLECLTYRMHGHVGPNDNIQGAQTDIRPPSEVARWHERDPITRLERVLLAEADVPADTIAAVRQSVVREVEAAHEWAQRSERPKREDIERYLFHV